MGKNEEPMRYLVCSNPKCGYTLYVAEYATEATCRCGQKLYKAAKGKKK